MGVVASSVPNATSKPSPSASHPGILPALIHIRRGGKAAQPAGTDAGHPDDHSARGGAAAQGEAVF